MDPAAPSVGRPPQAGGAPSAAAPQATSTAPQQAPTQVAPGEAPLAGGAAADPTVRVQGRVEKTEQVTEERSTQPPTQQDNDEDDATHFKDKGGKPSGRPGRGKGGPPTLDTLDEDDDLDPRRQGPGYLGDVSLWGRKKDLGIYTNRDDASDYTLSSGLSPRDTHPRPREFDIDAAKRTLAYNAGLYGKAQALRRDGTAPTTLGIADDLPTRFAYESLHALSGMANKVQQAIDRNKKVFEVRMRMEDQALLRRAFGSWRAARYGSAAKQAILRRAIARLQRGLLWRAFSAWKDKFHKVDATLAMRRRVTATINRGRLKRCFLEWVRLVEERWWKNQVQMRDETIRALERKIQGFELRPILVIRRRRLSAMINAWWHLSEGRRKKRLRFERAARHFRNQAMAKAWHTWWAVWEEKRRQRGLLAKAALRIKNLNLVSAWNKWNELILEKRDREAKYNKCLRHWLNSTLAKAWDSWVAHVQWRKDKKEIINRWKNPHMYKAFAAWVDHVDWRKRMRVVLERSILRMRNSKLASAFYSWREWIEDEKMGRHLSTKEELAIKLKEMQEENERLRRDNERFVRLIDSGEWGRGRVAELVAAGEVLKSERDALLKLIQGMRREYEAVQAAKGTQEDEMRSLKDRMMLGGAARNKMLVKGGSSFNALVRAMKQDLLEGGVGASAATKNPNALYEIDKLSMDHVTVFPDGQLNVEAIASVPATAAFARPISAGRALRGSQSTTLGPSMAPPLNPPRLPADLLGMPGGGSPGARGVPGPGRPVSGPGALGGRSPGTNMPRDYQRVLDTLQSLSPAEVDRLEALVRQQLAAQQQAGGVLPPVGGGPPPAPPPLGPGAPAVAAGMTSTAPPPRR